MKSQVRIIAGKWRGRKLVVSAAEGLRPTPDRIRETLFNWLSAKCHGAAVLDAFAGSGALGLEAMSRGATSLLMIEQNRGALAALRAQVQKLGDDRIEVSGGDALTAVDRLRRRFDLVFIDPPYAEASLRREIFQRLEAKGCLNDGAIVYFEWPHGERFELPSPRLQWQQRKRAGRVEYAIAEWRLTG